VCCIFINDAGIFLLSNFSNNKTAKATTYLIVEKFISGRCIILKGPGRDAEHFVPFRDCPGQSGTSGHPSGNPSDTGFLSDLDY